MSFNENGELRFKDKRITRLIQPTQKYARLINNNHYKSNLGVAEFMVFDKNNNEGKDRLLGKGTIY